MKTTLGTWRKPPLAYVVAELAISAHYSIGDIIPGLQKKLLKIYPKTIEGHELMFEQGGPTQQPSWQLISATQMHGIYISPRSISLHATNYLNSNDFLERWAGVLDALESAKLTAYVERAGLRYLDLIVPDEDRSPLEYVIKSIQGVTIEGAISMGALWQGAFLFDGCQTNMRVAAPSPRELFLPPGFRRLSLKDSQIMIDADKRQKEGKATGFIDTDCVKRIEQNFNARDLVSYYSEMHKLVSKTFHSILSPLAKEEWK